MSILPIQVWRRERREEARPEGQSPWGQLRVEGQQGVAGMWALELWIRGLKAGCSHRTGGDGGDGDGVGEKKLCERQSWGLQAREGPV